MTYGHSLTGDPFEYLPHYFDMRDRRYKRIDGSPSSNLAPEIGLEGTGFPSVIRSILRGVNRMELREEEDLKFF